MGSSVKKVVKKAAPIFNPIGSAVERVSGIQGSGAIVNPGAELGKKSMEFIGGGTLDPTGLVTTGDIGRKAQQFRLERMADMSLGAEEARKKFADVQAGDLEDIISRRKAQLEGLTPEERNLLETQGLGGIAQAEQGALRQLRGAQGIAGVRGGIAGAQQADILGEGLKARGDLQRDIVMQDIQQRRQALDQLESTLGRERLGFLTRQFGEAGLGAAERGAAIQAVVGTAQAQSAGKKGK